MIMYSFIRHINHFEKKISVYLKKIEIVMLVNIRGEQVLSVEPGIG